MVFTQPTMPSNIRCNIINFIIYIRMTLHFFIKKRFHPVKDQFMDEILQKYEVLD